MITRAQLGPVTRLAFQIWLTVSPIVAAQSLVLANGTVANVSLPNSAPYRFADQQNASFRFQFRVHNWRPSSGGYSDRTIWSTEGDQMWCSIGPDSVLQCVDWWDALDESNIYVDLANRSDFVVTIERDLSTMHFYAQVCDVALTRCTASQTRTITAPGNGSAGKKRISAFRFGGPNTSAQLAYFRWRTATTPSQPPRDTDPPADLLDMEFENNLAGSGPAPVKPGSASGRPSFAITPSYAPGCSAGTTQSFRAGYPAVLDGTGSVPLDGGTSLSYAWTQVYGPAQVVWKDPNVARPEVRGLVFGTYTFRLTVRDAVGKSSACTVRHGAVATDEKSVVVYPQADLETILGPSLRWGTNPWPWFDERQKALADYFGRLQSQPAPTGYQDFWNTAETGSIAVTMGTRIVAGTGTDFRTTFCGGGQTASPKSNLIVIWYPLPEGGTGRRAYPVRSCESKTSLTLTMDYVQATGSALSFTMADDTGQGAHPVGVWVNGSTNADYYDNVLAFYSLYYRSGLEEYRDYARTLADRWWTMPYIDQGRACSDEQGYWCLKPRVRAVTGLFLRALDGRPDMWPGLRRLCDFEGALFTAVNPDSLHTPLGDIREDSGFVSELSLAAKFDPDSAHRSKYAGYVARLVSSKWAPQQRPQGNWENPLYGYATWNGFPGTASVTNGSDSILGVGTAWDCANSTFNPATKVWTTNSPADFVHGDPINYSVTCIDPTHLRISPVYRGKTAAGRGWSFGAISGQGTQPFLMGFVGHAMSYAYEALKNSPHTEAAAQARRFVIDSAKWIANPDYGGYRREWNGLWYARGYLGCEPDPSANPVCMASDPADNNIPSSRYLAAETMFTFSRAFEYSGDAALAASADSLYAGLYSRSGGPVKKSDKVDLCDFLCDGSWDLSHYKAKTFGFTFGWGGGATWPAVRLGTPAPPIPYEAEVPFDLSRVPSSAQVRIAVVEPSGQTVVTVCSASPCGVKWDKRQGEPWIRTEYLSQDGRVLDSSTALGVLLQKTPN